MSTVIPSDLANQGQKPWERLSDESSPAWEAFVAYRDAGPERSIRSVAQTLDKSASLLGRWSAEHDWLSRAAAWDRHQDDVRRRGHEEAVEQVARRHAEALADQLDILSRPSRELMRRLESDPDALRGLDLSA